MLAELLRINAIPAAYVPPAEARSSFTKKFVTWPRSLRIPVIDDLLDILEVVQDKIKNANDRVEKTARDEGEIALLDRHLASATSSPRPSRPRSGSSNGSIRRTWSRTPG